MNLEPFGNLTLNSSDIQEQYGFTSIGAHLFLNPTLRAASIYYDMSSTVDTVDQSNIKHILRVLFVTQVYREFLDYLSLINYDHQTSGWESRYRAAFKEFVFKTNYFAESVHYQLEDCTRLNGHYNAYSCIWDLLMKGKGRERKST